MVEAPRRSFWIDTTPTDPLPTLPGDLEVDVAIVGGGMVGICAAYELKRAGKSVAVLEMGRVLEGVTGNTTAKLTAGHGRIYQLLERRYGADTSRAYADSNQSAIEHVAEVIERESIDCDFRRTSNYVYAESEADLSDLRDEVDAERRAGLDASFVTDVALPVPVAGALKLDDQAQFHVRKYLLPLVTLIDGDGSYVFEDTRVDDVKDGARCRVHSDRGTVTARDVIIATNMPFPYRGMHFARSVPRRSYVVAGTVDPTRVPEGMYISTADNFRSIRTNPTDDGGVVLMVGGEPHTTGQAQDTLERVERLEGWAREHFGLERIEYRWSTHDPKSNRDLPFIGKLTRGSAHVYTATGFGGWGMTKSVLSGRLLTDRILGRDNPYTEMYEAFHWDVSKSASKFVLDNAKVGAAFFGARIARSVGSATDVERGQAAYVRQGLHRVAAYRDDDGVVHACSSTCTHLGCLVRWNASETTWDCPCHGSRFSVDGVVVQGPATKDLERIDLD